MSAKHTPGPWYVTPADKWTTDDGRHVQFGRFDISAGSPDIKDEDYYRIASVSNVNDDPQNEANARLIAAAPDLLAALTTMRDVLRDAGYLTGAADLAIAKATGAQA